MVKEYDSLRLTGDQAVALAGLLGKTNHYYKEQKGSVEKVSSKHVSGGVEVDFYTNPEYGFSVMVSLKTEGFSFMSNTTLIIERKTAIKLVPLLKKAPKMIAYVNKVIEIP